MNKHKWIFGLPVLALVLMCGCGINTDNEKEKTTVAVKAEDPAASAVFKNSDTTVKESRYENDFTRTSSKSDEDCSEVWEYTNRTDGKDSRKADKGYFNDFIPTLENVMWITNDWLYYSDEDDEGIYRVPILYEDEILRLDVDKKEFLFSAPGNGYTYQFMVTDSYILGLSEEEDSWNDVWVRYDLKTKELAKVDVPETINNVPCYLEVQESTGLPVILKDSFFTSFESGSGENILYRVSLDTLKGKRICNNYSEFSEAPLAVHGSDLYIIDDTGILKYTGDTGELTRILERDTVLGQFDEMRIIPENVQKKSVSVDGIYSLQNKLFAEIRVKWYQEECKGKGSDYKTWNQNVQDAKNATKGKMVECVYEESVLISADYSDFNKWERETKLYEYMQQLGAFDLDWEQDLESGEPYLFEQPFFINKVTDEQIYFEYVDVEKYKEKEDYDTVETAAIYKFADGSVQVKGEAYE